MTVPVLFHRPGDGVDSSTGVRAHRIRTTELPADEFITWLTDRNGRVDISAGNVIYPRFGT